jgi:hypothetical protein
MMPVAAVAALLLAAPQQAAAAPEPVTIRLVSAPKRGAGEVRFEAKALFPDGIVLKGTLYRSEERLVEGRLVSELTEVGSDTATVEGRRVVFAQEVKDTGLYRLVVELKESLQDPDLLASLKKSVVGKWEREEAVWGDDFVGTLGSKLRDFDQQADIGVELIRKFAGATASSKVWMDHYPVLDKEALGFLKKLEQSGLERLFPAAFNELRLTMRNVKGNAEAVEFSEDGTCKGSIDYRTKKPTKTIHSVDFTFDSVLKDVEAAKRAAGGEFLLWVIKDYRRAGARSGLAEALRAEQRRPGLSALVEGLESFKDVDASERLARALPGGR